MHVQILKSKIRNAHVTACELYYEGSLGLDTDILDAAGIYPYEKLLVVNLNNGERLETYAIPEEAGSRTVCLNGPAARRGAVGDNIIVMAFAAMDSEKAAGFRPVKLTLNDKNQPQ